MNRVLNMFNKLITTAFSVVCVWNKSNSFASRVNEKHKQQFSCSSFLTKETLEIEKNMNLYFKENKRHKQNVCLLNILSLVSIFLNLQ